LRSRPIRFRIITRFGLQTTEKDAVKCRNFGRRDLIAVRVDAELDSALAELILEHIHGRATA